MKQQFKYGLKNAYIVLSKIRNKHSQQPSQLKNSKTFYEQSLQDQPPKKYQISDYIVTEFLQKTLKIYQNDLQILCENRDNLLEAINLLVQKIRTLKQLENKNSILQQQNKIQREKLIGLIKQYHKNCLELQKMKIQADINFNKLRTKARNLMSYVQIDATYGTYVQQWANYLTQIYESRFISAKTKLNDQQMMNKIYQIKDIQKNMKKQQKESPKKVPKNESAKHELLGNLKEFSKSFKVPL